MPYQQATKSSESIHDPDEGCEEQSGLECPDWVDEGLIQETLKIWQPYYQKALTYEDAVAILITVSRLCVELEYDNGHDQELCRSRPRIQP